MLYDLVQKRRGKETVVMTGELPKVRNRMKELRTSHRKGIGQNRSDKVEYTIRPSDSTEKYKKPPHNYNPSGYGRIPRVPKENR